jgi:hypothetical protein
MKNKEDYISGYFWVSFVSGIMVLLYNLLIVKITSIIPLVVSFFESFAIAAASIFITFFISVLINQENNFVLIVIASFIAGLIRILFSYVSVASPDLYYLGLLQIVAIAVPFAAFRIFEW